VIYVCFSLFFTNLNNNFNAQIQDAVEFKSQNKSNQKVVVGAQQIQQYFKYIKDKSIAIVGNQTSMIGNVHLVDTLLSLDVDVKMVFAPEHGFRGDADAGEKVLDGKDPISGLPIKSLYGSKNRKPSKEILKDVDVLIFDIQDVGVRFYTYISTMHYIMEACAEQNKLLIILDRPNPNGHYVDGPVLKKGNESFIGMHPVPIVHGMTVAEYAKMINGEGWLRNSVQCSLVIIPCKSYNHSTFYDLPVKPSPNLPNMKSIYLYPSLCLFEGTNVSIGRGTNYPFQIYGSPYIDKTNFSFSPKPVKGAKNPKHNGKSCNGYNLNLVSDSSLKKQSKLNFEWIIQMWNLTDDKTVFFRKDEFFRLLTGDNQIRNMIENNKSSIEIWMSFQDEVKQFKSIREKYLLYSDFEK
jgi:uncharacterized protein YbbC (DUF1343 family)